MYICRFTTYLSERMKEIVWYDIKMRGTVSEKREREGRREGGREGGRGRGRGRGGTFSGASPRTFICAVTSRVSL